MIVRSPRPQPRQFVFSDPKRVLQHYRKQIADRHHAMSESARTGPHTPFYGESDATRAARLFRLAYGRRLRCLLKAHSGVGPDAPEHDLVPGMAWRGFVSA